MRGICLAMVGAVLAAAMGLACFAADTTAPAAKVQVTVVCAGTTADGGWNQQGADAAAKAAGGTANVLQEVKSSRAADVLRDAVKRGSTVAICHGFEFLAAGEEVGKSQDKMKIVVTGADTSKGYEHIYMLDIDIAGPSYQLGVLAGKLSKTSKVGFIAGSQIPPVESALKAFEAGLKSVKPEATVVSAYTSWDEPVKSKTQAEAFIQRNVDVIFQDLDTASKGVFEAVNAYNKAPVGGERAVEKVYVFGCNSDQNANEICADATPASAVIRLDKAFGLAIGSVKDGSFKPGVHTLSIANGETECVLNPKLIGDKGPITKEIQKAVEEAGKKFAAGEIKIK